MPVTILLKAIGLNPEAILAQLLRLRQLPPDGHGRAARVRAPSGCAAKSRASTSPTRTARSSSRRTSASPRATCAQIEQSGIKLHRVPEDYLVGRMLARNVVDADTGEILAKANDEMTDALLKKLRDAGVKEIQTLYTNDLDEGAYISQTLRVRRDRRPARRARRHLPHDAPRRAADRRRGRGAVPPPVLLGRDLRPVARRPDEVQRPRRPRRARRRDDADQRGHPRRHQDPGRAAQRPRRGRRHRPPRQPPRALRRRAGREPVPLGPGARRAGGQGAPRPGRDRNPDAARPDQRQADLRGDQGVLRRVAAVAVHGPDQPAVARSRTSGASRRWARAA